MQDLRFGEIDGDDEMLALKLRLLMISKALEIMKSAPKSSILRVSTDEISFRYVSFFVNKNFANADRLFYTCRSESILLSISKENMIGYGFWEYL